MTMICNAPRTWSELVDYWSGELSADAQDAVDAHLMSCANCSALSERVAAITESIRGMIPPIITRATMEKLRDKGMRIEETSLAPSERKAVMFRRDVDLLVHRLGGLDLTNASRVMFTLHAEGTTQVLAQVDSAPFDRDQGAVFIACQRHFAFMPPDVVADVTTIDRNGNETRARYTLLHTFEPR